MRIKHAILAIGLLWALAASGSNADWRAQVKALINEGEFAKATDVLKALPSDVQRSNAITIDSLEQTMQRIRYDFRLKPEDGLEQIKKRFPSVSQQQLEGWKRTKKLETMRIDGEEWWFYRGVRNLWLLCDELKDEQRASENNTYKAYAKFYQDAAATQPDANGVRNWHRADITFTLDVDADAVPAGDTLRVWMPFPCKTLRQRNIALLSSNRPVTYSQGSEHHTVYMEAVAQAGKPTHFEYRFAYDVGERYVLQDYILKHLKPYDTAKADYKKYTGEQLPNIVPDAAMRRLADSIVGSETNPVLQAAKVYHWIAQTFPWAGARNYSTIDNIPRYVLANGHGDCGQVTLLYITLVRSLGIPARWESGYMLHPGMENFHDWGETYFEGVGWVPTDESFGRTVEGTALNDYYATGIDLYRFASNEGVGDRLSPPKKFIRSETVDFQEGEVEWKGGNLETDKWHSHLKVNSIQPIASDGAAANALAALKSRIAPDGRTAIWNVKASESNGKVWLTGNVGTREQRDSILSTLRGMGYSKKNINSDSLEVLEATSPVKWGIVKLSVASLRTQGRHAAEMATQALMGMPVKVFQVGEWCRVQCPDGYIAYVPQSSLAMVGQARLTEWRKSMRYVVTAYDSRLAAQPSGDETVSDLVLGDVLEYLGQSNGWAHLKTPDGREGYAPMADVANLNTWMQQNFNADLIEATAKRMMGSGYLWGGTSTKVTDCSGLMKVSYLANGIILQRDASQQALTGQPVADWHDCQQGDLLFFGNKNTGRVTHVGMYLRDGKFIHCSGQVKINSLDPNDPSYLYDPLCIRRIKGMIGTKDITYLRDHPWYF